MNVREIARRAGVSTATVSRVLNGNPRVKPELRDAVNRIVEELNYVPNAIARSMNHGTTSTIGLVLPDITNPFFPSIARGVEDAAISHGYKVILCNTDNHGDTESMYLRMLREQRVDGVILVSASDTQERALRSMLMDIPVVLCDRVSDTSFFSSVATNHELGLRLAVDHLAALGHRDIALLSGPANLPSSLDRSRYFLQVMADLQLPCPQHRIIPCEYRYESGVIAVEHVLRDDAITAVVCANDMIAFGAMDALYDHGLSIPTDMSIVGYDNISFSNWSRPRLTTVAQPMYLLGLNALEILLEQFQRGGQPAQAIHRALDPSLIVRQSTAKPSIRLQAVLT